MTNKIFYIVFNFNVHCTSCFNENNNVYCYANAQVIDIQRPEYDIITLETFPDENDHLCIPCVSEELALNFHRVVQECVRQENRFYEFDVKIL